MHSGSNKRGHGLDQPWDLLVIGTRDPVDRTVSAFNYELGNPTSQPLLDDLGKCYATLPGALDAFATHLNGTSECAKLSRRCLLDPVGLNVIGTDGSAPDPDQYNYCGHLNMDHRFYLQYDHFGNPSLLNQIRSGRTRAFIVRTETFETDISGAFTWLCQPDGGAKYGHFMTVPQFNSDYAEQRHGDTKLSDEGKSQLHSVLAAEYLLLDTLEHVADNGRFRLVSDNGTLMMGWATKG